MAVLDLERLRAYSVPPARDRYDPRDAILYALGTGAGLSDTIDELDFVYEHRLKMLPTYALVLGTPGFWPMDPKAGLDWPRIIQEGLALRLYQSLEPQDELVGETRIGDVADEGAGAAALLRVHRVLRTLSGTLVAEIDELWKLRGAGGFGGTSQMPDTRPIDMPSRAPDAELDLPTSRQQAMLYRLSGDRNPMHVEPEAALRAGFDRPPLHQASTLGLVTRAVAHLCCGGDPTKLSSLEVRFGAPVFPGETVRTELWREGGDLLFRSAVPERGKMVIESGRATIGGLAQYQGEHR
jgi:acyl dehydratase